MFLYSLYIPCARVCHSRDIRSVGGARANYFEFYIIWRLASCQSPRRLGTSRSDHIIPLQEAFKHVFGHMWC